MAQNGKKHCMINPIYARMLCERHFDCVYYQYLNDNGTHSAILRAYQRWGRVTHIGTGENLLYSLPSAEPVENRQVNPRNSMYVQWPAPELFVKV